MEEHCSLDPQEPEHRKKDRKNMTWDIGRPNIRQPLSNVGMSNVGMSNTSRKSNPPSAPRHTKPERQRNKCGDLAPGHRLEFIHHCHSPFDRKREEQNQKQ